MRFWIIHAQEHLAQPRSVPDRRVWRSNALAEMLADRGHAVVRWRSSYSHHEKRYLAKGSPRVAFENFHYQYLDGPPYRRSIGLSRIQHHKTLGRNFEKVARTATETPDLIHVGNVPLELSLAAVRFGRKHRVPVVVDIRDLWPDLFLDLIPTRLKLLRPLGALFLHPFYRQARETMRGAKAVSGITTPFVEWGLRLAGREGGPFDRAFHMSYPEQEGEAGSEAQARVAELLGPRDNRLLFVYLGNIGYQSDFDTLIAAARRMQGRVAGKFVICGDGPKLEAVRRQSAGLENVAVPGWLNAEEVKDLLNRATVGLLPYHPMPNFMLNMPNKFAEYLAGGLILACGLEGEMARMIRQHNCGFVYPARDATALADQLTLFTGGGTDLAALRLNAKKLYEAEFNCREVHARLCDYLELLAHDRVDASDHPLKSSRASTLAAEGGDGRGAGAPS